MKRLFAALALLCALSVTFAQTREVRVGLLRDLSVKQAMATCAKGTIAILADGVRVGDVTLKDGLKIRITQGKLVANTLNKSFNAKHDFTLRATNNGIIRLRALDHKMAEREYTGAIEVQRVGVGLMLINEVPLEDYVAGTVQSEAGNNKDIEYYKLQAVSCRTYVLANVHRHLADGFEVCDGTHCQVYKGRNMLDTIRQAVEATRNMVAVDAGIHLIHATFHSNCGGETMNAEDLWSKSEPYLVSTEDTFCLGATHASWRRMMAKSKWLGYLKHAYGVNTSDSAIARAVCSFGPNCRELYLGGVQPLVSLEQVRADMKFNSAYFSITCEGDNVIFDGRGYGHGVGLCQEGAMRMARDGYSFIDILHHYFAEVHLVDLSTLDFFRDEGF